MLRRYPGTISVFPTCEALFCRLTCDLFWRMFHVCSEKKPILLVAGMFCHRSVRCDQSVVLFKYCFLIDLLSVLSVTDCEGLKSSIIIMPVSISPLSSVSVCFIYVGSLMRCIYNYHIFLMGWSLLLINVLFSHMITVYTFYFVSWRPCGDL